MSKDSEVNRREFLKTTAKAGAGLAALGTTGLAELSGRAQADSLSRPATEEAGPKPKGNWPQEYTVQRDEACGQLALSTPYYSIVHDLKHGGVIARISYTHGEAASLLVRPMAASIELAAPKLPYHITEHKLFQPPEVLSDLHDSSPSVTVAKSGRWPAVIVETTLRTSKGRDASVRTKTSYQYRWGYVKIHKEFTFPAEPLRTATLTVLSTTLDPGLTGFGHRPFAFDNARMSPFSIEPLQWGEMRAGSYFDPPFSTRYVPCHMLFANPGIEGIEWFAADDLGQWDYQMTGEPGTGYVTLDAGVEPLGVNLRISPLALPTNSDLARGGYVSLSGSYSFDYYIGMTVLEGHAYPRWLEMSFGPNRGQWVSDQEIQQNAKAGIVTMTLHNDGDVNDDCLFWRDGTYPPYPPDQMKKMEHVIETCHQNGIKVLPYFSNHELHQSTQAYEEHGEEWGRKPDDQGNLRPEYYYGSHMCFKSGWKDFFKSYVDTVLKHQPWNGVYYDWNMALYCNNPLHVGKMSNGVSEAKGLAAYAISPTGHWGVDEFLEVMEWTRERVGPEGLVTLHNTGVPMFAAENFADYIVCMEWGYGKLLEGMPKPDQLPLEWNLAGARSRADIEYGSIDLKAPPRVHRLFYLTTLMTGTAPWPASDEASELFKILKPLGNLERYHFTDWRNRVVKLPENNLVSAVYSRPGEAFILLANLDPKPKEVNCVVDLQALKHPLTSLQSAALIDGANAARLDRDKLTDGGEKIMLLAEGVRLLHLQG